MSRALLDETLRLKAFFEARPDVFRGIFKSVPPRKPSKRLYVSGLHPTTTSHRLKEAFSRFGQVVSARVITQKDLYSKGMGFVKYSTIDEASKGIKGMDGMFLDGQIISTVYARRREWPAHDTPMWLDLFKKMHQSLN